MKSVSLKKMALYVLATTPPLWSTRLAPMKEQVDVINNAKIRCMAISPKPSVEAIQSTKYLSMCGLKSKLKRCP